jgi:hypothetical protein
VTFTPSLLWISPARRSSSHCARTASLRRARGDHRARGRRDPQPLGLVRAACAVRRGDRKHAGPLRWFAFDPLALDLKATALAIVAAVLAFRLHRSLIEVVGVMALLAW